MQVISMGDIANNLVRRISLALPYIEEDILKPIVVDAIGCRGIVISATRDELSGIAGNILYKEVDVVPKKEMPKDTPPEKGTEEDIRACENCGKKIAWDEFCNNFGWCDECMGTDLDKYRRTHPEQSEVSEKF